MELKTHLLKLRHAISNLDKNIVKLLSQRKILSIKVANVKIQQNYPIRDIIREQTLLEKLITIGKKYSLDKKYIINLFKIIINDSVLTQTTWIEKNSHHSLLKSAKISFLGDIGSYSYLAAKKYAYNNFEYFIKKSYQNFSEIIISVENEQSDYAVLPIENTSSGLIREAYSALKNTSLFIVADIFINTNHCLLAKKSTQIPNIKEIYSHIQPLKQCSKFINYFPNWKLINTTSTTDAIKKISYYNDDTKAALGNKNYGTLYKLEVLAKNICNKNNNVTRFVILNKKNMNQINKNTSLIKIILIEQKMTEFTKIIKIILKKHNFAIHKLKLYVISQTSLEKIFFIEIKKLKNSACIENLLENIHKKIKYIKILGVFPLKIFS